MPHPAQTALPLALAALLMSTAAMAKTPQVAVDIAPVHALVAQVMEGVGTPALIVAPGATPHEYSLRPSEAAALAKADLVVWVGADLTPWLEGAIATLAGKAQVLGLFEAEGTQRLAARHDAVFEDHHDDHPEQDHEDAPAGADKGAHDHAHDDHAQDEPAKAPHAHDEHAHDEHAQGDQARDTHDHDADDARQEDGHSHGAEDPHAWLSPVNAAHWLDLIAADLARLDPANAATYRANAARGQADLAALTAEVNATLAPHRGARFVVFHDAYQYFETAFDLPATGALSVSDATDPSPARVAEIGARIARDRIDCVLSEPQFNPGLVAAVQGGTPARTAVLDPLGAAFAPGPQLYGQMMRAIAQALAGCL